MVIKGEDNPSARPRKATLRDAIIKFHAAQRGLEESYGGRPYDSFYEGEDDRINGELDEAVRAAVPFKSPEEAAAAVLLERDLLIQFHGEDPAGIHGTRLAVLDAIHSYLAGSGQRLKLRAESRCTYLAALGLKRHPSTACR